MKLANAHWHFILSIIRITGSSDHISHGFWCYCLIDFNLIFKWKVSLKVRCGIKVYSEASNNAFEKKKKKKRLIVLSGSIILSLAASSFPTVKYWLQNI